MKLKWNIKSGEIISLLGYHSLKRYRIVELCLHAFLVSTFDGGGQLSDLVSFTKGRKDTDFIEKGADAPENGLERGGLRIIPGCAGNLIRSSN
jgi:hypothetical protein